ncbi:helix-turn-helix transcriptional regulator [Cohnella phaseoli]|uniref:Putative molybdopterin biosynthesis protein n=1 Tax=Cohnella phaseoli TaxID=456490 RepID=A0A3D9JTM3_9BACL|nr:helix-turn-helix transcriptional regulator [Cohnella phaseoli]RED77414.1 putative molybdopterin biosynthesis protein [Cohnella phaseoli]
MSSDQSYTTEEIAQLLKISKLTVYDLIKKGKLPAYRVGKQMRVDATDLEAYKRQSKGGVGLSAASTDEPPHIRSATKELAGVRPLVITGQDMSLDILSKHIEKQAAGFRALRSFAGSLDSLISMYQGQADLVSTHLLDGDTGEYNLPYIRKILVGSSYIVVNLLARQAGFYVRQGNPFGLKGWQDLDKPGLRLVNREIGSGARVLLDEQLRLHRIAPSSLLGYDTIESNHLAVAGKVGLGEADVGIGIEKAAAIVGSVAFIPLIRERYDLVMRKSPDNARWIEAVLDILKSEAYLNELRAIQGYDLSETGTILLET